MPRAIIHIGMPRTGTTSFQRVLCELRPRLMERGVLYPDLTPASAAEPHLSHQHLGEALDGRRTSQECDELFRTLSAGLRRDTIDTVILSYESLVLAPPGRAVARRLGEVFARHGYATDILVTVKPQSEYINSMYTWRTQFLREGRSFDRYAGVAVGSPRLHYDKLIAPWIAIAGARLIGVPLHDPQDPAPLIARILDRSGLSARVDGLIDAAALALMENRSPGPLAVEASRRLAGARVASGAAREVTRLIERLARDAGDTVAFQGVDAARQASIMRNFAVSNRRFADAAWGRPWEGCAAPAPAHARNEIAGRSVSAAETARIDGLVAAAAARFVLRPMPPVMRGLQDLARDVLRIA